MPTFAIGDNDFLLDGEPFRVLSGALHYFRVHPDQWGDRIRGAKAMGLNTIETYVAWNAHAPQPDRFDLDGGLDLGRFLDAIADEGMYAIVRPGPYICAEWDNGGLPAWIFSEGRVSARSDEPAFMAAVEEYMRQLAPVLVPRQVHHGGPIILVQIENEYGAYGSDANYLRKLVKLNRDIGLGVPFTTVDQPTDEMLGNGSLPELLKTASFGSRAVERLATLRKHQPTGPLMCSEFWEGWFDHWGAHHHTTSAGDAARELDAILSAGASVNIYMVHGGTNFGFTNGANDKGVYQPTVTSYDYDAPLDEAGRPTAKFHAFREVIARHAPVPDLPELPEARPPVMEVPLTAAESLLTLAAVRATWQSFGAVPSMDCAGQYSGFAMYRTRIATDVPARLSFAEVRDRAQFFLDDMPLATLSRDHHERSVVIPAGTDATLMVLVEDQGRVNYGPRIGEPKGLIGPARLNGRDIEGWEIAGLDVNGYAGEAARGRVELNGTTIQGPCFAVAEFEIDTAADLFLSTAHWGKGVAWVNGFCLGRYWSRGPQRTLFVPEPVVHEGSNTLVILELMSARSEASFVADLDLGHTDY